MALFEIIIELPVGVDVSSLSVAATRAGYEDAKVAQTDSDTLFSVLISHSKSSFETGNMLAEMILSHLPTGSRYLSHRSAVSIQEMSVEDLDAILVEIENSIHGSSPT